MVDTYILTKNFCGVVVSAIPMPCDQEVPGVLVVE